MNPDTPAPPAPANPYWHRFANNVIACKSLVDSYLDAGFHCTKATAYVNASKLRRKPVVDDYIRYCVEQAYQQCRAEQMKRDEDTFRLYQRKFLQR